MAHAAFRPAAGVAIRRAATSTDMRTVALAFLTLASVLMVAAFVAPGWASGGVTFVLLASAFPVALMALGAQRDGRLGPVAPVLGALLVVLLGTSIAMLVLRGSVETGPWLWGMPLVTALQLIGLFVLPLIVVSLGHAWTFERWSLREDELSELRRRFGPAADRRRDGRGD